MSEEISLREIIEIITRKYFKYREKNYDYILAVCGAEGSGKSTFSVLLLGNILLKLKEDPKYKNILNILENDLEKLIYYDISEEEFKRLIFNAINFYDAGLKLPFILDEAGAMFYHREAMKKSNIIFNKFLIKARALGHCYIFCSPSYFLLDKYIREFRVYEALFIYNVYSEYKISIEIPYKIYAYFDRITLRKLFRKLPEKKRKLLFDYGVITKYEIQEVRIGKKRFRSLKTTDISIEKYATFYSIVDKHPLDYFKNTEKYNYFSKLLDKYNEIKEKELLDIANLVRELKKQ